jgi:hypothetical protein
LIDFGELYGRDQDISILDRILKPETVSA